MFGIGETELVIIVVFAFLLFGPDKLPGMGRTLGRVLRQFREASDGFTEVVQTNIMDPASEELEKSPKQRKREAAAEAAAIGPVQAADAAAEEGGPERRETFAERKARLMAERKAREAQAADTAAKKSETDTASASDEAPKREEGEATSSALSAADLFSLDQRSSRFAAAGATAEATTESGEEEGSA